MRAGVAAGQRKGTPMAACGDAATLVLATDLARVLLGRIEDLHLTDLSLQLRGF